MGDYKNMSVCSGMHDAAIFQHMANDISIPIIAKRLGLKYESVLLRVHSVLDCWPTPHDKVKPFRPWEVRR